LGWWNGYLRVPPDERPVNGYFCYKYIVYVFMEYDFIIQEAETTTVEGES
jgi:hypothetical protein